MPDILIGLDGGGTHTRVLATDIDGRWLGLGLAGACNPEGAPPEQCVAMARKAIGAALEGITAVRIVGMALGIAGRGAPGDGGAWAEAIPREFPVACTPFFTGDNDVAHQGAFAGSPGVIALAGTGSIVFGVNASGKTLCNFDLGHWAHAAAWTLGNEAVLRLLAGEGGPADQDLVVTVCRCGECEHLAALRARRQASDDFPLSRLAPAVTAAALAGSPVARAVCDRAAWDLALGVRLLAPLFGSDPIPVAPAGSVALSLYMRHALRAQLGTEGRFIYRDPLHGPLVGAIMMAARRAGRPLPPAAAGALDARLQGV